MKVAFDTSAIVPALVASLPEHAAAVGWLDAAKRSRLTATMSWHAVEEVS